MNSLQGKKILITRDIAQTSGLKEKLAAQGAEIICVATIAISDPPDWSPFDKAAKTASEFDWIVFTSINAVKQTANRLSKLSIESDRLKAIKKAAVGDKTAEAVIEAGWQIDLVPEHFQAEGLLEALLKSDVKGKQIWMPRALKARNFLIDELQKAGAVVTESPVYQNTIPYENRGQLQQVLLHEKLDWITFTSSSTVSNFLEIVGKECLPNPLPKLASIGHITTKTLEQQGLIPSFTAEPQNLEGLCQGILEWEATAARLTLSHE
ncbi:MAG: uroporphyrinogen-III synthase [SAR324 cluster bacterium]|nr:uroporphyrinogen-III synthase [SAR324 cluster bacterium]